MTTLSVVIPCYNESSTLEACVQRVLGIASDELRLEIVIVDDASTDDSLEKARALALRFSEIRVFSHSQNQGKGAALRTGFREVTGDFVAVQDADLEYDPRDLLRLLEPLVEGRADVIFGSRFLTGGAHRVLYFWHSVGNRFLTLMSNIFTDLNLTDMETCYKVFRRDIIQSIEIEEDRFGFEPEIVAKIADQRLRIYEMGISYDGRTYQEGKKIGASDGFRALYCILRYNARQAPLGIQLVIVAWIGMMAAIIDLLVFGVLSSMGTSPALSVPIAFGIAVVTTYSLCVSILFHRRARWQSVTDWLPYVLAILAIGVIDSGITHHLIADAMPPLTAKAVSAFLLPIACFAGRRFLASPSPRQGPWGAGVVR